MTTFAPNKLDGTLAVGNADVDGETAIMGASFRIALLSPDNIQSEGTDTGGVSVVRALEPREQPSASSKVVRSNSASLENIENQAYWVQALAFVSGGVSDSVDTQTEFDRLATELKTQTAHLSSATMIAGHRAFQEIVGMGKDAIPFILRDLKHAPTQWFLALRSIARESPVRPEDRGNVEAMAAAWLDWGEQRRYI